MKSVTVQGDDEPQMTRMYIHQQIDYTRGRKHENTSCDAGE